MVVLGHGLLYVSLPTPYFFLESRCLQAQQVRCAAAPKLVLVETKRLLLWVEGYRGLPGASLVIQLCGCKPNGEPGISPWVLLLHLH